MNDYAKRKWVRRGVGLLFLILFLLSLIPGFASINSGDGWHMAWGLLSGVLFSVPLMIALDEDWL